MKDIKITLPLKDYLNDLWSYKDGSCRGAVSIPLPRALLIYELDKNEEFCHIEFLEDDAILWDLKEWKQSQTILARKREESDKYRRQYFLDDENINIVSKALADITGIKDKTLLRPLAVIIIKERKFDTLPTLKLTDLKVYVD